MAQMSDNYKHFISDAPVDESFPDAYKSHLIEDIEQLKIITREDKELIAFDVETTGLSPESDFIVSVQFSVDPHNGYYVPIKHYNGGFGKEGLDIVYDYLRRAKVVAMHNCRFDARMMEWSGFTDLELKYQRMWLGLEPYEENEFFKKSQREHYLHYDMSKLKIFDTQNSCWLSDTNDLRTSLKKYELKFLGWRSDTFEEAVGSASNWFYTDYHEYETIRYATLDTIGTFNLALKTKRFVDEAKLSGQIDNDVLYPMGRMEEILQRMNRPLLEKYSQYYEKEIAACQDRCWNHAGRVFNLGSVKEKSDVLDSLGVYTGKRTKSGNMATGKDVMEKVLREMDKSDPNYKFVEDLVSYNNLVKQKSSYVDNIIEMCKEHSPLREDALRFNYKLTLVPTGRLASGGDKRNPFFANLNIQNIPKPHPADYHVISIEEAQQLCPDLLAAGWDEEKQRYSGSWLYNFNGENIEIFRVFEFLMTKIHWKKIVVDKNGVTEKYPDAFPFNNKNNSPKFMEGADQHLNTRSAFLPMDNDSCICSLDYSAQELRCACLLSGEPTWEEAFVHGKDLHRSVAEKVFGPENYDKEKRKLAKGINFGIIYGMGPYTFASRNNLPIEEAEQFFAQYQAGLPTLFAWLSYVQKKGRREGTVYTMFGRPRRVSYWANSGDPKMRSFADRTSCNSIVQGSAADISKISLIKIFKNMLNNPNNFDIVRFHSTVHI